jgi:ElaB/YqjD/DUF883 family membrane-anchored ribosome-binding protein
MENQVTLDPVEKTPVEKTPEQIESEMHETRESLTEKVSALENQVMGTVQSAANTITDTVDAVKSFVSSAPETVSETVEQVTSAVREQVQRTFDISGHVRSNPWQSVCVSVGVGFLAGFMIFREEKASRASKSEPRSEYTPSMMPPPPAVPRESGGVFDDLLGMLGRKVKEMTETAIDAATASVNKNIRDGVPKIVEEAAKRLVPENTIPAEQKFDAGERIYGR